MQKPTSHVSFWTKVSCNLFGHEYKLDKRVSLFVKEYTCSKCNKHLTLNHTNPPVIEIDPKFEEINAIIEDVAVLIARFQV